MPGKKKPAPIDGDPLRQSKVQCSHAVKARDKGAHSHVITITVKVPAARAITDQQVDAWARKTADWCQTTADAILGPVLL